MKRRIRTRVRAGWHLIEIVPTARDRFDQDHRHLDTDRFSLMTTWCRSNVDATEWDANVIGSSGSDRSGMMRFIFKSAGHAAWFKLAFG